jgi:hypothetical protein
LTNVYHVPFVVDKNRKNISRGKSFGCGAYAAHKEVTQKIEKERLLLGILVSLVKSWKNTKDENYRYINFYTAYYNVRTANSSPSDNRLPIPTNFRAAAPSSR